MEELIDLIAIDGAPHEVSDKIKELLYAKAADRIDSVRPEIATVMFGDSDQLGDDE
jgi:mitochondrial fission protein ELM1